MDLCGLEMANPNVSKFHTQRKDHTSSSQDNLAVTSTHCSYRGSELGAHYPHGGPQCLVILAPVDLTLSSDHHEHCAHMHIPVLTCARTHN